MEYVNHLAKEYYIPYKNKYYKVESTNVDHGEEYRDTLVNYFNADDIETIVYDWIGNDKKFKWIDTIENDGKLCTFKYLKDDLEPTKEYGHPQATIRKELRRYLSFDPWTELNQDQVKVLRHLVVWRFYNQGAYIPKDLDISHCDVNSSILNLVAESKTLNESRKYCHKLGWHTMLDSNGEILCPHRYYHPCTKTIIQ